MIQVLYNQSIKIIPKIIVWAHNSHIGNSNATNRGGKGFEQNNTWNVGQMVKEMFPYSYAIGFYTDNGFVYAGKKDTKIGEIQKLNPAHMYSYENIFHSLSEKYNIPVVEDACQSILGSYNKKNCGTWGITGSFSFHPLKNINIWADGGMVVTGSKAIYYKLLLLPLPLKSFHKHI